MRSVGHWLVSKTEENSEFGGLYCVSYIMGHEKLDYAQGRQSTEATPWFQRRRRQQGGTGGPGTSYKALFSLLFLEKNHHGCSRPGSSQVYIGENFRSSL